MVGGAASPPASPPRTTILCWPPPPAPPGFSSAPLGPGLSWVYICGHLTRRCRRDPAALPLGACLGLAARLLVFLLLPLLILAALTEAYVTPPRRGGCSSESQSTERMHFRL